jgi:hypothetical protein
LADSVAVASDTTHVAITSPLGDELETRLYIPLRKTKEPAPL